MTDPRRQGLFWCAVFVLLDAAQAVYLGGALKRFDAFLLGGAAFGASALFCGFWAAARTPDQLRLALADPPGLIALNVSAAGAWILYFIAIPKLEPAVAFTLFTGMIPLTTLLAARLGVAEARSVRNAWEAGGNALLGAGLVWLVVVTMLGLSGVPSGELWIGLVAVLGGGVLIAAMLLASQRLDGRGVGPTAQFALRFPLYLALAVAGAALGWDAKPTPTAAEFTQAFAIALLVLAFPIYAVQRAVALTSALTIGAAAAMAPLVVFLLQGLEGRVLHSNATLAGLAITFAGAIIATIGGVKSVARGVD